MSEYKKVILLKKIHKFISKFKDYYPMEEPKKSKIIGYYNNMYHDYGFCFIYLPAKKNRKLIPILVSGYEARDNGDVYIVTNTLSRYNLSKCFGPSIESVYGALLKQKED